MPRCREEERIIFPLGGFVAAALIRGTRAGKRDARARESTRKQKNAKEEATRRDDDEDDGGFDVGEMDEQQS